MSNINFKHFEDTEVQGKENNWGLIGRNLSDEKALEEQVMNSVTAVAKNAGLKLISIALSNKAISVSDNGYGMNPEEAVKMHSVGDSSRKGLQNIYGWGSKAFASNFNPNECTLDTWTREPDGDVISHVTGYGAHTHITTYPNEAQYWPFNSLYNTVVSTEVAEDKEIDIEHLTFSLRKSQRMALEKIDGLVIEVNGKAISPFYIKNSTIEKDGTTSEPIPFEVKTKQGVFHLTMEVVTRRRPTVGAGKKQSPILEEEKGDGRNSGGRLFINFRDAGRIGLDVIRKKTKNEAYVGNECCHNAYNALESDIFVTSDRNIGETFLSTEKAEIDYKDPIAKAIRRQAADVLSNLYSKEQGKKEIEFQKLIDCEIVDTINRYDSVADSQGRRKKHFVERFVKPSADSRYIMDTVIFGVDIQYYNTLQAYIKTAKGKKKNLVMDSELAKHVVSVIEYKKDTETINDGVVGQIEGYLRVLRRSFQIRPTSFIVGKEDKLLPDAEASIKEKQEELNIDFRPYSEVALALIEKINTENE